MDKKTNFLVSRLVVSTFIFMGGLWTIDINMGLANLNASGFEAKISTLLFDSIEPRVSYHLGILMTILGFFGSLVGFLLYSTKEDDSDTHKKNRPQVKTRYDVR